MCYFKYNFRCESTSNNGFASLVESPKKLTIFRSFLLAMNKIPHGIVISMHFRARDPDKRIFGTKEIYKQYRRLKWSRMKPKGSLWVLPMSLQRIRTQHAILFAWGHVLNQREFLISNRDELFDVPQKTLPSAFSKLTIEVIEAMATFYDEFVWFSHENSVHCNSMS